ncbi:MAG: calcium/sodium antiporter [Acidimicrobiales bacterium]
MLLAIGALVAGLGLLAIAPDRFMAGSAALADRFGVSRIVIGAVVIGFGTSTPEMLVSGVAALRDEPEVGIGNIVGSNIANIGLIVGVAALVCRLSVPAGLLRRELPLTVAATLAFAIAVQDGIERGEAVVLLACLAVSIVVLVRVAGVSEGESGELVDEIGEFLAEEEVLPPRRFVVDVVLGLVGTLVGAQLLVSGALEVADQFDLSGGFVGVTVVALGTSLPELVTAVVAARAGEDQLILGNVLGSNLFNSLAVGGIVGLAGPAAVDDASLTVGAVGLMLAMTALGTVAMIRKQKVTRGEALTLLVTYLACVPLLAA